MIRTLEIQQFSDFPGTFPGNFPTICASFQIISGVSCRMERAPRQGKAVII